MTSFSRPITASWRNDRKIAFRFFFILLISSSLICWDLLISFALSAVTTPGTYNPAAFFKKFEHPLHWLDQHIYHTGYAPLLHKPFPGDNHFGAVFYLSALLLSVAGTIIWSLLDRKTAGYDRARYWLRFYLRYVLATVMFSYGIDKLIPVQMNYPGVEQLLTPLGEQSRFEVLWSFMGVSPGYMILTGVSEIIAALFLFYRRTLVLGCLMQLAILVNVVAFNFFYNVPVKLFSSQLLLYTLFLLYPYAGALWKLFFSGENSSLDEQRYGFQKRWEKSLLTGISMGIPLLICLLITIGTRDRYQRNQVSALREKLYDVETFVAVDTLGDRVDRAVISLDTLPPLLTDPFRWKRFLFANMRDVVICNMKDEKGTYSCEVDSTEHTYTLHDDSRGSTQLYVFHYAYLSGDRLNLTGKWKEREVNISLRSEPIDSMEINKEKTRLIWD